MASPGEVGTHPDRGPTTKPAKSRWRGCLIGALIAAAVCGAGIVRYGLGFIQQGKRPPQIGREVRARLSPGLALREALGLAHAAARNEPATPFGNPIAFVWAHCTSLEPGTRKGPLDEFARDTRVFLFNARESASVSSVANGLPATVFLDQPGANPTDSAVAVDWLSQCPEVEIVFESGFFGGIYLPMKLTPEGRVESVGESRARAK